MTIELPSSPLHSPVAMRKIIHCDMDAFYASVEQRDNPKLRGLPVVVGGSPQSRAVVCAASYEARKFGVRSAMSCSKAARLCPQAVFVPPDFSKYSEASEQIHKVFNEVTHKIEPLSLDEAFLDVTENLKNEPSATRLAQWIKDEIFKRTSLTASAGVGPNKFVAKIASDYKKPNGLTVVRPEQVLDFLKNLPIERLWGVGPVTATKIHDLGARTIADIRALSPHVLEAKLGSFGPYIYDLSFGKDDRPVEFEFEPKSRGTETTFNEDTLSIPLLENTLLELCHDLAFSLKEIDRQAKTVTLKIKYSDFKQITRSRTLTLPIVDAELLYKITLDLMHRETEAGRRPIRLVGISASQFVSSHEPMQLWLKGMEPYS